MARIIGSSGSTDFLRNKLRKVKIDDLDTFDNIKTFNDNFPQILQNKENEERAHLTSRIDTLKNEAKSLSLSINVAEKSYKKDKKQIKKIEKSYLHLEKKIEKKVKKKLKPLHKADVKIKDNFSFLLGAEGEEIVINELSKLPDTYFVFNEYRMKLAKYVYNKSTHGNVRSCRIDHLVIGPTGIFIIETKNWSAQRLRTAKFLPHHQVDNAGLVFYIFLSRKFRRRKFSTYKIVVMLKNVPKIDFPYVRQLSLHELNSYILRRQGRLSLEDVNKIVSWLSH